MRYTRLFTWLPLTVCLAFVVCSCHSNSQPNPGNTFDVTPTQFDNLTLSPGDHEFVIHIKNTTDQPKTILGFKTGCWESCCTHIDYPGKITVPSNSEFEFHCGIVITNPGIINAGAEIFLEDNGIRKVFISFKGIALGPHDAPKNNN